MNITETELRAERIALLNGEEPADMYAFITSLGMGTIDEEVSDE